MSWRTHLARHSDSIFPSVAWVRWTAMALLALAAGLRLWHLEDQPYTHDELSGLIRTGYDSFGELMRLGVSVDAHPPATAVLLHYWTMLFGYGEAVVKLPFLLLSIVALFLLYRTALAWTNETVALLTLAYLATLQYTVLYAQIARPYALGFFTAALLVDQWTRYLAQGPNARRALIGTAIGFLLCAYTHHFSMLFATLVAVTGLFLCAPAQRKGYLLACGAAVLLYAPYLPIFFQQLGYGGVGQWLAAPDAFWLQDHLWWAMEFLLPLALLTGLLIGASLVFRFIERPGAGLLPWLGLLWWAVLLGVGMGYSVWVDPVLQYSVLLFPFPFLLIALFHGLPPLRPGLLIPLSLGVAGLGILGLVEVRKHYEVFSVSKYEAIVRNGMEALAQYGTEGAAVLIDAPEDVIRFQLELMGVDPSELPYIQLRDAGYSPKRLDSLLGTLEGRVIAYGESNGASPEQVARIQDRFPHMLHRQDVLEGQLYRFAMQGEARTVADHRTLTQLRPDAAVPVGWKLHEDLPLRLDSARNLPYWDYGSRDFGILLHLRLDSMTTAPHDLFEVSADLLPGSDTRDVGLVVELVQGDSTVFYRTDELERAAVKDGRARLVVATRMSDAKWRSGPIELKAYLYNRAQKPLAVLGMALNLRDGNPWRHGLFEDLSAPNLHP